MEEIKFKNLFVDGTKIEAYANKYTFVWKKAAEKNLAKLNEKIEKVLPTVAERYGVIEYISIEECYEQLLRQAQWVNHTFVQGKGKHKTQLLCHFIIYLYYANISIRSRSAVSNFAPYQ